VHLADRRLDLLRQLHRCAAGIRLQIGALLKHLAVVLLHLVPNTPRRRRLPATQRAEAEAAAGDVQPLRQRLDPLLELVPHAPVDGTVSGIEFWRVVQRPVLEVAGLPLVRHLGRAATDADDRVERRWVVLRDRVARVLRDVNANLGHHCDSMRVELRCAETARCAR